MSFRFQPEAIVAVQHAAADYLIEMLQNANLAAKHASHITSQDRDIKRVRNVSKINVFLHFSPADRNMKYKVLRPYDEKFLRNGIYNSANEERSRTISRLALFPLVPSLIFWHTLWLLPIISLPSAPCKTYQQNMKASV